MENPEIHKPIPAWKSPWVIGWVASIVIVLGVNATMVWLAIGTNPGLVVKDYYERGQHYEKTLVSKLAKDPGWLMTIDPPAEPVVGRLQPIRFSVVDKAGVPVRPDTVTFHAYRPSDASRDFSLPMKEEGPGRYRADVAFPLKGIWDLLVSVRQGGDEFNVGRRISVLEHLKGP